MSRPVRILLLALAAIATVAVLCYFVLPRNGDFHRSINDHSPRIAKPLVMTFDELSRSPRTSTVRVKYSSGTSVASSMWSMMCNVELAEERGAKYFIALRSWMDRDGTNRCLVGYSDQPHADPASYFGVSVDAVPAMWISVDDFRQSFPRQPPPSPPATPLVGSTRARPA